MSRLQIKLPMKSLCQDRGNRQKRTPQLRMHRDLPSLVLQWIFPVTVVGLYSMVYLECFSSFLSTEICDRFLRLHL